MYEYKFSRTAEPEISHDRRPCIKLGQQEKRKDLQGPNAWPKLIQRTSLGPLEMLVKNGTRWRSQGNSGLHAAPSIS